MAASPQVGSIKNWQNVGEALFGDDLNSNFNLIRGAYNEHTHSEYADRLTTASISGLWTFTRTGPPFLVGNDAAGHTVEGLSAELLGDSDEEDVMVKARDTASEAEAIAGTSSEKYITAERNDDHYQSRIIVSTLEPSGSAPEKTLWLRVL
jgi:hypothetical protein